MANNRQQGSIELVVLGLLAALIVVLAVPLFSIVLEGSPPAPMEAASTSNVPAKAQQNK